MGMKLLILITSKIEDSLEIGMAWENAGAPGVTVVQSHGLYDLSEKTKRGTVELPRHVSSMAGAMAHVIRQMEFNNHTILSVVPEAKVDELVKIATDQLGDLNQPDSGIIMVIDLEQAIGVRVPGAGKDRHSDD